MKRDLAAWIAAVTLVTGGLVWAGGLDARLALHLDGPTSCQELLAFLAEKAGYKLEVRAGALIDAATGKPRPWTAVMEINNAEVRYPLSWALHFARVSARFSNDTIIVSAAAGTGQLPRELDDYTDKPAGEGGPQTCFGTDTVTVKRGTLDAVTLLKFLSLKGNVDLVVIDPAIVKAGKKVRVEFDNVPVFEAVQ